MNATFRTTGDVSVEAGRGASQLGWYRFAAQRVHGRSVLDVGCGLGVGLEIMRRNAAKGDGQDLDPRLAGPGTFIGPVEHLPDKSYDVVTCIDVVEHVEDHHNFLKQLKRIARQELIITTPLSMLGRQKWAYHVREYRFDEFMALTQGLGQRSFYKGNPSGDTIFPNDVTMFLRLHRGLNNPVLNVPTRAFQKLLPGHRRNFAHQAVVIDVTSA